ncbi:MAG: Uma2 family endonuclease [Geitlerinemataceae cyanobacterium]
MIATSDPRYITIEAYLAGERESPIRHEYRNGEVYAMSGGSDAHITISGNFHALIWSHLRGSGCRVYMADMKVRIERKNCCYYPDVMVTCDDRDKTPDGIKHFPKLVIEVLSPSTQSFDRGVKFTDYCAIETLEEYVTVRQNRREVEVYRIGAEGNWSRQGYSGDETIELVSLGLALPMNDVYEAVI